MNTIPQDQEGFASVQLPTGKNFKTADIKPYPWQMFFDQLFYLQNGTSVFKAGKQGPVLFCIHGAGHSALSFATLARQAKKFSTVVAIDYRGHGMSKNLNDPFDMSIQTLVLECQQSLNSLKKKYSQQNFIIIGHSLGGSVASRIAQKITTDEDEQVNGLVIIDVVQGTAMQSLPFMMSLLNKRPKNFKNPQQAILWVLSSQTLRNKQSARVSILPQLSQQNKQGKNLFKWKVPLQQSQKYWKGWFQGLSDSFLRVKISKILFTAQKQRLDNKLMVAQMQGKFRLMVIKNVGHSVQQDDYQATAKAVYDFMKIFKIPPTPVQTKRKIEQGIGKYKPNFLPY